MIRRPRHHHVLPIAVLGAVCATASGPWSGRSEDPPGARTTSAVPAKDAPPGRAVLIPWLELNTPDTVIPSRPGITRREHAHDGLRAWRSVADMAIITTRVSRIDDVYRDLSERKPAGMFIIGGFKTADFFRDGRLDDAEGWAKVAAALRRVAAWTGCDTVVLENETALAPFNTGKVELNMDRLAAALKPVRDTGLKVWWNLPAILLDTPAWPDRRKKTAKLVDTIIRAVPGSTFLVGYRSFAADPRHPLFDDLARQMTELVGKQRLIDKYHVRAEGGDYSLQRKFYAPADVRRVLGQPCRTIGVIYTGENHWVSVALAMAAR